MAQKVNPIAVRLHLNRCSNSFWFSDYYYAQLLSQDYLLRNYIQSIRPATNSQWGFRIGRCVIHRYPKKALFHIFYQIPRLDGSQRAGTTFSVNSFSGRGVNSRTAIIEKNAQESEARSRWNERTERALAKTSVASFSLASLARTEVARSRLALATFLEKKRKSFAFPLCDLRYLREAEAHKVTKSRKLAPKVSSVWEAIHRGKRVVSADNSLLAQPISGSTANQYASIFVDLSIFFSLSKGVLGSFFGYRPGVIDKSTVRLSSFDYHPIEYYLQDSRLPFLVTEMSLRQTGYRPLHFPFRNLAQSWINLHWLALRYLFWQKYCISAFQNPVCRPLTNILNSLASPTQLSEFGKRKDLGSKRRASQSELESFAKGTVLEEKMRESDIDRVSASLRSLRSFVASHAINSNKFISLEVYKQDRPGTEGASRATQANELGKTRKAKLPNESLLAKGHEMRKKIVKNSNYWRNIESVLSLEASNDVQIIPVRSTSLFQSASLLAQEICVQLMQKQSFPKIWKNISRSLNRQKPKVIKGMRISCSGRLNGAEIAKTESRQWGETSLHVFQDQIDYAKKFSLSPYGILGVKVWISYSE
uniref:Small ribosomal subunit protein uS3m n=1 Tax=Coleochaete scutata TaxID=3125 RepID=A0A5P9NXF6_COLSC|nr:ribosomal protein S3 [Coleochaete scutata]QFU80147.1 ribosomal protein S3 [Coleochaete scutata]